MHKIIHWKQYIESTICYVLVTTILPLRNQETAYSYDQLLKAVSCARLLYCIYYNARNIGSSIIPTNSFACSEGRCSLYRNSCIFQYPINPTLVPAEYYCNIRSVTPLLYLTQYLETYHILDLYSL